MKDEIKEILDKLKNEEFSTTLFQDEKKQLLDYITNLQEKYSELRDDLDGIIEGNIRLQEENERLKKKLDYDLQWSKKYDELFEENKHLVWEIVDNALEDYEIYRDRCDNAIEYIEKNAWYCGKDGELVISRIEIENVLNILKGE